MEAKNRHQHLIKKYQSEFAIFLSDENASNAAIYVAALKLMVIKSGSLDVNEVNPAQDDKLPHFESTLARDLQDYLSMEVQKQTAASVAEVCDVLMDDWVVLELSKINIDPAKSYVYVEAKLIIYAFELYLSILPYQLINLSTYQFRVSG